MQLDHATLRQYVDFGQELRGVEFKSSVAWGAYESRFIKGILAMANKRDGGVIIVGWDATNGNHGISPADLATFDIDTIQPSVNRYAAPYVEVALQPFQHLGVDFLALGVEEFRDVPVICQRDTADRVLKRGTIYVRSFRQVATTAVQTPEDMRELLDLATDKGIERFLRQARGAGLDVGAAAGAGVEQAFAAQLRRTFE